MPPLADFPSDTNLHHFLDAAEDLGLRHLVDEQGHVPLVYFPDDEPALATAAIELGAILED